MKTYKLYFVVIAITLIWVGFNSIPCRIASAQTLESSNKQPTVVDFPIQKLKDGGYIIIFRHTTRNRQNLPRDDIYYRDELSGRCKAGHDLSAKGIEEAHTFKKNFERVDIPVGRVYVSPPCRMRQMADIIFGEKYQVVQELIYPAAIKEKYHKHYTRVRRDLYTMPTMQGKNRIIITHNSNVWRAANKSMEFDEGDAVILKPLDDWENSQNDFHVAGVVKKQSWLLLRSFANGQ